MDKPDNVHFDGPCPFLTCLVTEPHDHPICAQCGAVRYGNPFHCQTCEMFFEMERDFAH